LCGGVYERDIFEDWCWGLLVEIGVLTGMRNVQYCDICLAIEEGLGVISHFLPAQKASDVVHIVKINSKRVDNSGDVCLSELDIFDDSREFGRSVSQSSVSGTRLNPWYFSEVWSNISTSNLDDS